jgi:hypothetical protein
MAGSGTAHLRNAEDALLRVEHLVVEFPVGRSGLKVSAVANVSLDIIEGETLGIVGESGCGKSTTGRAIVQLPPPKSGSVVFDGVELTALKGNDLRKMRPRMQMIFQDPISSLNPRRRVREIVGRLGLSLIPFESGNGAALLRVSGRTVRLPDGILRWGRHSLYGTTNRASVLVPYWSNTSASCRRVSTIPRLRRSGTRSGRPSTCRPGRPGSRRRVRRQEPSP